MNSSLSINAPVSLLELTESKLGGGGEGGLGGGGRRRGLVEVVEVEVEEEGLVEVVEVEGWRRRGWWKWWRRRG